MSELNNKDTNDIADIIETIEKKHHCDHKQCGGKNIEKVEQLEETMPVEEEVYDVAELFKVLGDQTRVKILFTLIKDEMCVCDIADLLEMSQSAISHQLRVLKQARLVKYRREGKTVYYSVSDEHVAIILNMGIEHVSEG
ncbi:metalloregulator ArsR/SmtB family transcription factor [Ruminococcus sp.]|uniref:ArsR/SmtB family transcription factor n=1 Tax=Ruminococcus sp. TaxID=41978 RepID=UPI0025ECA507|nr:metalloregulator ArsR/SmtB family transcription factor [Ruminococcus sp.]